MFNTSTFQIYRNYHRQKQKLIYLEVKCLSAVFILFILINHEEMVVFLMNYSFYSFSAQMISQTHNSHLI